MEISTAAVYGAYEHDAGASEAALATVEEYVGKGDWDGLVGERINSLTEACLGRFPALGEFWRHVEGLGVGPLGLAGSGSTLYATSTEEGELVKWEGVLRDNGIERVYRVRFCEETEPFLEEHHADF